MIKKDDLNLTGTVHIPEWGPGNQRAGEAREQMTCPNHDTACDLRGYCMNANCDKFVAGDQRAGKQASAEPTERDTLMRRMDDALAKDMDYMGQLWQEKDCLLGMQHKERMRSIVWRVLEALAVPAPPPVSALRERCEKLIAEWNSEAKRIYVLAEKERGQGTKDRFMAQAVRFWECAKKLAEAILETPDA